MTTWRGSRGQVLIIAVLVLFAVASLAALLAAIVGAQIVQVTRYADVTELRNAAESILSLANEQLTYGWQGADWRPPSEPYRVGKAIVGLTVDYGPAPPPTGDVQKRFMRISVAARFPDDPFLRYSVLGFKPLLLTDYARFITDRYELRQPAALGAGGVELGGLPRPNSIDAGGYEFTINGPIRSNTDLEWHGRSRVNLFTLNFADWTSLGLFRDDRIEVAGAMRPARRPGQPDLITHDEPSIDANSLVLSVDGEVPPRTNNVFMPNTVQEQNLYLSGFADETVTGAPVTNSWRVLADLSSYRAMFPVDPDHPEISAMLSVPRVQPPRLDATHPEMHTNRYLILTRDSGKWTRVGAALVNTGTHGWGWGNYGGIYLDNVEDIQYGHDLDKLRLNWMGDYRQKEASADGRSDRVENPPPDWWDRTGRYYTPPGAEIILHGEAPCPYVEIIRHTARSVPTLEGPGEAPYYWRDAFGNVVPLGKPPVPYSLDPWDCPRPSGAVQIGAHDNVATFPFPPNGVIYAEGNVRVRGVMPQNGNAATAPTRYFGATFSDTGTVRRDRCYDLQIVSGGTIYIEGDLLSATAARTYELSGQPMNDAAIAAYDRDRAARLALVARDNVCVNTTALHPRPANLEVVDGANVLNDSQPVYPKSDAEGYPPYMWMKGPQDAAVNADAYASDWDGEPMPTEPPSAKFLYWNTRLQLARLKALLPEMRLLMGHAGWYVGVSGADGPAAMPPDVDPDRTAQVQVRRLLAAAMVPWSQGQEWYTFRGPGVGTPTDDVSEHWYLEGDRAQLFGRDGDGKPLNDYLEFLPNGTQTMALDPANLTGAPDELTFESRVLPVRRLLDPGPPEAYEWVVRPNQLGYILGPVAVAPLRRKDQLPQDPLPVEIDALVYAQNGSWFILPGPWFNEDPDEVYESEPGGIYPAYHEPLNIAIRFYGAISENMPAPIGDVSDWTSKWAGPYGARGGFLTYTYDPVLRWYRGEAHRPVFPNLLLTPDLIVWGERVAGARGAGT